MLYHNGTTLFFMTALITLLANVKTSGPLEPIILHAVYLHISSQLDFFRRPIRPKIRRNYWKVFAQLLGYTTHHIKTTTGSQE